jgi:hypothetical protein
MVSEEPLRGSAVERLTRNTDGWQLLLRKAGVQTGGLTAKAVLLGGNRRILRLDVDQIRLTNYPCQSLTRHYRI